MLTDNETQHLHSQNKLLLIQLQEAEEVLAIREEELAMLRQQSREAAALKSELNNKLNGMEQMQR
ncbi:MAG: hypothetical protein EOO03_11655 [Chitinophagaceae bacterium]|nr:MAG: hypothetical protein EOO03_11655 [Chitinophagaceae bacterium]